MLAAADVNSESPTVDIQQKQQAMPPVRQEDIRRCAVGLPFLIQPHDMGGGAAMALS